MPPPPADPAPGAGESEEGANETNAPDPIDPTDPTVPTHPANPTEPAEPVAQDPGTSIGAETPLLPVGARGVLLARRAAQFAVDCLLVGLACLVPLLTLVAVPRNPDGTVGGFLLTIPWLGLVMLSCAAISYWYWAARPHRHEGQTLGMRLLRLQVVDASGRAASRGQLALRWLALLVDLIAFGLVGAAAILGTPRGQRFGDLLASTVVVDAPPRPLAAATPPPAAAPH